MSVKIVTDSTADLTQVMAKKHDIEVVPLNVHFGEEVFKDGIEITTDQFFDKLLNGSIFPSTSQPSIGEFIETYRRIGEPGDEIVSIHISSKLSGTFNSAEQASKMLEGEMKIHVVDTQQVAITVGLAAIAAARVVKEGGSGDAAASTAKSLASRSKFFALFDTLEFLAKGGRIGKAQSMLGSMLNVKPLLTLNDGLIEPYAKSRSRKSGLSKLEQAVRSVGNSEEVVVIYSTDDSDALAIADKISDILPNGRSPLIVRVGPVIGTHAGPQLVGVGVVTST